MAFNVKQFLNTVIKPSLQDMNADSLDARALLLCTAAHESHLGTYLKQQEGPALGVYQMEPFTYRDIVQNYLAYRIPLSEKILKKGGFKIFPFSSELATNLKWSTYFARLHYMRIPEALPSYQNVEQIAQYWKKYYNTMDGKGTVEAFIRDCHQFLGDLPKLIEDNP